MLQLNNVEITINSNERTLVRNLSFTLNSGDKVVIIGEEGNGKSTLLKLIYDPALVEDHVRWSGQIIKGAHRLGYLCQEISESDKGMHIYDYMEEYAKLSLRSIRRVSEICGRLGLSPELLWEDRTVGTLSGGEKVKLQLARILLDEPDVLLLDEPTNDIDIETLEWLEGFINSFSGGVLFVSHDEMLIENTALGVIHLEHIHHKKFCRHTVARVPYSEYMSARERALDKQEQTAKKEREEQREKEDRWREIYEKVDRAQKNISRQDPSSGRLLKKKMHSVISMGKRIEKEGECMTELPVTEPAIFIALPNTALPAKKEVLRLNLATLHVNGETNAEGVLANNICLNVNACEHIGIIGKNGVGKSTLLRKIADELLCRNDIKAFYMPQNYAEQLTQDITPIEYLVPSGEKAIVTMARTYMGSMRYTADEMESTIAKLSGGQKAKLLFVKMSLEGYNVLLLDEPTRNFSPLSNPVIRQILADFEGCIISVTHDRKYLEEVCHTVYKLKQSGLYDCSIQ